MSLKSQIENLAPGESFITKNTRTGIYVAAKRAGVEISTEVVDSGIKVTRKTTYQKMVEVISLVDQIAALPTKDRLTFFENFELCCGMNRGECVCESGLGIVESLTTSSAYQFSNAAEDEADDEPDEWEGWSDEQEEYDGTTGETIIFRKQLVKPFKIQEIRREH